MSRTLREDCLSKSMKLFLKKIDNGSAYDAKKLKSVRPSIVSALAGLVDVTTEKGLPAVLNRKSAEALVEAKIQSGMTSAALLGLKSRLRKFAYETGEGLDWAIDSMAYDQRKIEQVLMAPHWSPFLLIAHAMIEDGYPAQNLRRADRWLRFRKGKGELREEDVYEFSTATNCLVNLSITMSMLDPGNPENLLLQKIQRKAASKGNARKIRERFKGIPADLRAKLIEIEAKNRDLSASSIKCMVSGVRKLLRSTRAHNLKAELTIETATAFAEDLMDGSIKYSSAKGYCDFLNRFARYGGYSNEIVTALADTMCVFRDLQKAELSRKEVALAANPLELVDVAISAHRLLEEAPLYQRSDERRLRYNLAGAAAMLCKVPLRALDLRMAVLGKEILRTSEGWSLDITTSKTGTKITATLPDCLTPYLDAVLLHDVDERYLWKIYDKRIGQPLWANVTMDWKPFGENWLWNNFRNLTGHGPHIMRTLIYDECALSKGLDVMIAGALCGHSSTTSRKSYEINAEKYRRNAAMKQLERIAVQVSSELEASG